MTLVFFFLWTGSFILLFRLVNEVNFLIKQGQFFEIFRSIKNRPSNNGYTVVESRDGRIVIIR